LIGGPDERADLLIVSDLPLQGGIRVTAAQMAAAITFVLRERGFRTGGHRISYQSCDDSLARTGLFEEAKCTANARAYAANADVVAVIGTLNSPCAVAAVPELNRARRAARDGLAAQLLRGPHAPGARRRSDAARVALSDRSAQLPARVSDGRSAGRGARASRA